MRNKSHTHYDVIIAGGGVIGSACAYFLTNSADFNGTVAVIEPDPSYQQCATTLSASSIRQQFSTPINIQISQFGYLFLQNASRSLSFNEHSFDISFINSTYLYLATEGGRNVLESNVAIQQNNSVDTQLIEAEEIKRRYRWMNVQDIDCGSITAKGEGWFDSYQLLMGLGKNAKHNGAHYIRGWVNNIEQESNRKINSVKLEDGTILECDHLVNASGTRCRDIAALVGIELPVFPRKRCVFVFDCKEPINGLPMIIDPSGLWLRSEGRQFICGLPPDPDENVEPSDFLVDHTLFEERIWLLLANRVPAFNRIKVTNSWAGHYDYNVFDQNAIVGPDPEVSNFYHASGFSGHGLQQAPAVGRGIAEQIIYNEYKTLDLYPLCYGRILDKNPLVERNII